MARSDIDIVRLFDEKAKRLLSSGFVTRMRSGQLGVTLSVSHGVASVSSRTPTDDELHAVANNLRFFLQNNERTSVANMSVVYERIAPSDDWRRRFRQSRENLNTSLDEQCGITFGNEALSRRRLLLTTLYGYLSHASEDKEADFKRWTRIEPAASMVMLTFFHSVAIIIGYLDWSVRVHRDLLLELGHPASTP